jgi:hypothetical protein
MGDTFLAHRREILAVIIANAVIARDVGARSLALHGGRARVVQMKAFLFFRSAEGKLPNEAVVLV